MKRALCCTIVASNVSSPATTSSGSTLYSFSMFPTLFTTVFMEGFLSRMTYSSTLPHLQRQMRAMHKLWINCH